MQSPRVVVTGMGAITPLGDTVERTWDGLVAGRSAITRYHEESRCCCKIGGDLTSFDAARHLAEVGRTYGAERLKRCRRLLRPTPLSGCVSTCAALQAFVDAGLAGGVERPEQTGHVLAGHNLHLAYLAENFRTYEEEPDYIDPLFGLVGLDTDVLSVISDLLAIKGPSYLVGGACASGSLAILNGLDLIRAGRAERVIVTGAAVEYHPTLLHGWALIEAVSTRSFNDDPTRASRPFDARREGFVPSQGAGALVLETLTAAEARGAPILAELYGGASASDASRLPKPDLDGQARSMRGALDDAGISPEQVDTISAHATSTSLGDAVEVAAIKEVFGAHAYAIPVNAPKSMLGHTLTAAGVLELIACIEEIRHGLVHPTINQEEPDPELDLDFVPNEARAHEVNVVLSSSFGFGGLNSAIVVGRLR